ncbi:MAG: class I SAM-dependent methyltransferase [Chloroflexota bacterium]
MAVEAIYEHPEDYDLEVTSRDIDDFGFWRDLVLREQPERVLEVGAGTGRLTVPLARLGAEHGFTVTGLELEPAMLEQARRRGAAEGSGIESMLHYVQGDVRSARLPERFEVILLPYGVAHHLVALDDQLAAWHNLHHHLKSRGLLCIDLAAPDFNQLSQALTKTQPERDLDARTPDGRLLTRTVTSRFDRPTQLATHMYRYRAKGPDGKERRYRSDFAMHVYFPREVELLCRGAGFRVERMLGSYSGEPFDNHSELLITLARAEM